MKTNVKDENGFILPVLLGLIFIISAIVLTLSADLQNQINSFERTRKAMILNVSQSHGLNLLEEYLTTLEDEENFVKTWTLYNNAIFKAEVNFQEENVLIKLITIFETYQLENNLIINR